MGTTSSAGCCGTYKVQISEVGASRDCEAAYTSWDSVYFYVDGFICRPTWADGCQTVGYNPPATAWYDIAAWYDPGNGWQYNNPTKVYIVRDGWDTGIGMVTGRKDYDGALFPCFTGDCAGGGGGGGDCLVC